MKKLGEEMGDHCEICRQIREGCEEDARNPEKCDVCSRKGYFINPATGKPVACNACQRGFRLKLWIRHEQREGHVVPEMEIAA